MSRASGGPGDWGSPAFSLPEVKDLFEGCCRGQGKDKPQAMKKKDGKATGVWESGKGREIIGA